MRASKVRSRISRTRGRTTARQLPSNHLVVMMVSNGRISYEFTVDGSVSKSRHEGEEIEHIQAEANDQIQQNADGTVTVTGETGNWHGDAFQITGEIVDFTVIDHSGPFRIVQNGEDVTEQVLNGGGGDENGGENGGGGGPPVNREQAAVGVLGLAGAYMFLT